MDHELHWASQIVSAAGHTLLEKKSDDSHANLGWDARARALVGHPMSGRRAGLRIEDGTLVVVDEASREIASKALAGETLASSLAWLASVLDATELRRPEHELPSHPVGTGAAFTTKGDASLASRFALAAEVLGAIATRETNASAVRCWPHHFDIATLISLGSERTIGVGLSPGDASYAEPYWYVTPWPYPKGDLPALAHGTWHREGWTGAVLLARAGSPQPFLDDAIAACRQSLQSSD